MLRSPGTPRFCILVFLLLQQTHLTNPTVGVTHPLTVYVSSLLPTTVPLPTFYLFSEREILYGTSLEDALSQKLSSLEQEFETLREATESMDWCRRIWWDPVETNSDASGNVISQGPSMRGNDGLRFSDWLHLDSLYRSRALDLPGTGHAMVPCVDMANHASGDETSALYETDKDGNAVLQFIPYRRHRNSASDSIPTENITTKEGTWEARTVKRDQEITISYGDEKGASEMLYSYGFLEEGMTGARQLFLDLDMMEDDPLAIVKKRVCDCAPGVRLFERKGKGSKITGLMGMAQDDFSHEETKITTEREDNSLLPTTDPKQGPSSSDFDSLPEISWESPYLLWTALNEEDGLNFTVTRPPLTSSSSEPPEPPALHVLWQNEPLPDPSILPTTLLPRSPKYPVFLLRAELLLLNRINNQLSRLEGSEEAFQDVRENAQQEGIRIKVWKQIRKLRDLELTFLRTAKEGCQSRVEVLMKEKVLREYLSGGGEEGRQGAELVNNGAGEDDIEARQAEGAEEEDFS
ncbi:putative set domain protein [Phaeomoniella chlamydospora]|uniref:Putative set domain protein n=1 Tax=Phaeomoniella chlamydospora TaxID=158046 RepID=A0A0G2EGS8_PHACM|nr:putative set domain protein [Phaeomoniella chlamydospora]